ncbi:MAG: acetyltransferase [Proteocatella sp.]
MKKKPVIVLGAGGHAKVLINSLIQQGIEIIGITDNDKAKHSKMILGKEIIGSDELIYKYSSKDIWLVNGIGSINSMNLRQNIYFKFKQEGYFFSEVIHPDTIIAKNVKISEGVQIMAGAIIQPGCVIGENTIINTKSAIDHDCIISRNVHIAPGCTLCGGIYVGESTHIGTGTVIVQNKRIGNNVLLGAGSLVLDDIDPNIIAFGMPAKRR